MRLFYLKELNSSDKTFFFPEEESKHIVKVLRLKNNDEIEILNGKGLIAVAKISDAHPKKCQVEVVNLTKEVKKPHYLHIAICPTKNTDRIEWMTEKLTEIGVDKISFLISKNSERKNLKLDRLQKIVISASKQSKRTYFPELEEMTGVIDFLKKHKEAYIAHCYDGEKLALPAIESTNKLTIIIGPEGDFTKDEVEFALNNGNKPIKLGDTRLRTETAGLYAAVLGITKLTQL